EGDIEERSAFGIGMANILQHLKTGRLNIDLFGGHLECLHELEGVAAGLVACCKARKHICQDIAAWQTQPIERLSTDDQRMRRIQSSRNTDNHFPDPCGSETFHQAMDLDVVRFETALIPLGRI